MAEKKILEERKPVQPYKNESAAEFRDRFGTMLADSMVILALSLGDKVGLIKKLISYEGPKTCKEIAEDAGVKERYLQEWLGVMTTAGIVDLHNEGDERKFYLPQQRRVFLSDEGQGMAVFSWFLPMLSQVHNELGEAFNKEGPLGVPYDSYKGFHEWRYLRMQTAFNRKFLFGLLESIPGLVKALESGITVCDMGCSSGHVVFELGERFPNSKFYGLDLCENAIEIARNKAKEKSVTNCLFDVADICNLSSEWTDKFEYVVLFDVLHDLPKVSKGLSEILKTMKQGAYMSVIDINMHTDLQDNFDNPLSPMVYGLSLFNCVPTSLSQGGDGMGAAWGIEKATRMIQEAGFCDVKVAQDFGLNIHIVGKK